MEKLRFRAVIFDIPGYNGLNSNRDCNMKEVGKRLKALRESIGISQVKMAEAIGSTQSSVNRYENGQSTPPVELFRHYADYFDVSLDYILSGRTSSKEGHTSLSPRLPRSVRKNVALLRCALTRGPP